MKILIKMQNTTCVLSMLNTEILFFCSQISPFFTIMSRNLENTSKFSILQLVTSTVHSKSFCGKYFSLLVENRYFSYIYLCSSLSMLTCYSPPLLPSMPTLFLSHHKQAGFQQCNMKEHACSAITKVRQNIQLHHSG